ncbi:MAG: group II intron reverse transcriptase/maturase [Coriobacteriia bacterium]|nr:group II intron reverse transcriptase/maturase [Coriobacteriia bacterium]
MGETQSSPTVFTKLQRIAEAARRHPERAFTTLAHHIDIDWLREAYRRTRKDGAPGIDGRTAAEYAANLEGNLQSLLDRFKSGRYRAPPVRRVHIPKGDGKQMRPIGIPTFEDKVLQRAIAMLLEAIYEQDFLDCSFGFRPGRSAHQALEAIRDATMPVGGGWVLEVDVRKFFDTLDHGHLVGIVRRRVRDGVLLRVIGKWLNAGVLEQGGLVHPESGTPQGGVISPLLANIYLHEVVDLWFRRDVLPRLKGRAKLVRYADDMVLAFEWQRDASRVLDVLPKRFGKYGLSLHPDKTRLVDFRRMDRGNPAGPATFDFLGFTHHWGLSRRGAWLVKQRTAKDRFSRALHRVRQWCRAHRHDPLRAQQQALARKLRGHYGYFGVTSNYRALERFHRETRHAWRKWLSRRSNTGYVDWDHLLVLLERFPLPPPRIVHQYVTQRSPVLTSRMR